MEDFIKRVIVGNGITPPEICVKGFSENFIDAINIEWFDRKEYFEAIFYKDNIEHIASFRKNGSLIGYKSFLTGNYLPEAIKLLSQEMGEIMNVVLINKGNSIEYEVIIRDNKLKRHLYLYSNTGALIEQKEL